ncbi:putative defense protein Hdd11 [Helicoverpa armigera]|uniref:putative defense protein Hdd11 n=1 Tax=Helicoverpa armigera TaxID=29058 RepID=UPI000B37A929|nr:putative defense protein Hdd11 [Helicoverpa armigera]XP_021182873.1 putative defense protein Hdd11 [Helicoverpa armigera]XP_047042009.1 putative defense protein Hdd11 [Helicoverpa zea]XP_047042010.1 putative defense protein Hdd11 [Helicoverpa zea]XP_049708435.1 putative defense protein Hdd11 [Helicoverpa armigera]XP_049708436.1 putative defense protein Hdd11 [Helicoverpa armigera]PZC83325.1 hypothetical protein B5X24_HaOG208089 [Helicoverpa armigera]
MWASYVVLAVSLVAAANAYSTGAPESVCQDMVPKHPVPAQSSPSPYTITTSTKTVKAGAPMEVVISGKAPSNTIRGLLLQARQGDKIVGKFTLKPNDPFAQLLNCGEPGNAVTHKKHNEKFDKQTVAFTWTPPAGFSGEIKFRATIALNGAVFWVGVESAPVQVSS